MSNLFTLLQRSGAVAATHSGSFHADDVWAAAAMRLVQPSLSILRTRDQNLLDAADVLFDVGRVFDPVTCRFDHHQLDYREMRENGIPYSSFGLIWRELGGALCGSAAVASKVDLSLVQGVDAMDCGVVLHKEPPLVTVMTVSSVISGFNPGWQDDTSPQARDSTFEQAVSLAKAILQNAIRSANGMEQARHRVAQGAMLEAGRLLLLEHEVPWKEAILEGAEYGRVLYVVSPDGHAKWQVNAVPDHAGSFNNRKSLPRAWAGLDGEELDNVVGLEGCVFCHKGRFVAGHKTKDGALEMARFALRNQD